MRTLYRYEMKKIMSQKILWAIVLLMTLVLAGAGLSDVIAGRTENSKSCRQFSGRAIDESLIREMQQTENQNEYIVFRNFIGFCMGTSDYGTVNEEQVYAAREASNRRQMEESGLSEAEKQYWQKKEDSLSKPFVYQYEEGFAGIFSYVYVANFMLLIATAIGVSGVFADEKTHGTDQIIFSSVNREKLFGAKLLAGTSTGVLLALYLFVIVSACSFGVYGTTGYDAPLQIRVPGCMLKITIGQAYFYMFMLFILAGMVYAAGSVFFSQILGNHSATIAVMVIGLFLSMVNVPEQFGAISIAWSYLPGAYIGSWTFTEYRLIPVFGRFFNNLQAAPVLWIAASIVLMVIAEISYKNYQIRGR